MKSSMSFRTQQFYTMLALALVPLLLSLAASLPIIQNFIVSRTRNQLEIVADLKTREIQNWILDGENIASLIADRIIHEIEEGDSTTDIDELIETRQHHIDSLIMTVTDTFSSIQTVSLLHPSQGYVLSSTDITLLNRNRRTTQHFIQGQEALYISPVEYSIGREKPTLIIGAPVRDSEDNLIIVLEIEMNLSDLEETLIGSTVPGETGQIYLVETYGFYVTVSPDNENPLRSIAESEGVTRALAGENGSDTYLDPAGIPVLGVYRSLPGVNMGLLVEIQTNEFTTQYFRIWIYVLMAESLLFLFFILLASELSKRIVAPIERIRNAVYIFKTGDLSKRTPVTGSYEIQELGQAFNEMADSLEQYYQTLEDRVNQRTTELSQANEHLQKEIVERKEIQNTLQTSEARFRSLVENSPDYIMIVDKDYRIQYVNNLSVGFLPENVIGNSLIDYFLPETRDLAKTTIDTVWQTKEVHDYETRGIRRDGRMGYINVRVVPIMIDGEIDNVMLVGTDITVQKKTEEHIHEQAHLLNLVFDHMIDMMAILDKDFNFVRVSESYAKAGQREAESFIGQNHFEVYPSDFEEEALDVRENKYIYNREKRPFVYPDHPEWGTTYWNVGFVPILDKQGEAELFLLTLKNVTENVQAEESIQSALKEKETLLKEIHHRVKNNLQVISSLLRMQSTKIKDPEMVALFRDSEARVRSMAIIHEQLYQSDNLGQIELTRYIHTLVTEIQQVQSSHRNVRVDMTELPSAFLAIDRAVPCGLIVNEVVSNAYKHAFPDGTGTIKIKLEEVDEHYILTVQDDGIGLPDDVNSNNTLGLRLLSMLVMQIDGDLDMKSSKGTSVIIKFPK